MGVSFKLLNACSCLGLSLVLIVSEPCSPDRSKSLDFQWSSFIIAYVNLGENFCLFCLTALLCVC